ncbi:hypothetical protein KAR91_68125 [Candidatus Pacearchaeota archaeon]|nr:hypothetical protein [Candidatus Pacearchaeota archaeon]
MSKFEDTMNNYDVECPYCHYTYYPEGEENDEERRIEECQNCDKRFYRHDEITVDHHTSPDCELNGEQHDYQPCELNDGSFHHFCETCEKCMPRRKFEEAS